MEEMFCCITHLRLATHESKVAILGKLGKGGQPIRLFADDTVFFYRLPQARKWLSVKRVKPSNDGVIYVLDLADFAEEAGLEDAEQLVLTCGEKIAEWLCTDERTRTKQQAQA